jgi:hypothetical protein
MRNRHVRKSTKDNVRKSTKDILKILNANRSHAEVNAWYRLEHRGRKCDWIGGVLSRVGDHILPAEFYTLYLTKFRTPGQNPRRRGLQTDKHLPQSPFPGNIFLDDNIFIAVYQSNLSTD